MSCPRRSRAALLAILLRRLPSGSRPPSPRRSSPCAVERGASAPPTGRKARLQCTEPGKFPSRPRPSDESTRAGPCGKRQCRACWTPGIQSVASRMRPRLGGELYRISHPLSRSAASTHLHDVAGLNMPEVFRRHGYPGARFQPERVRGYVYLCYFASQDDDGVFGTHNTPLTRSRLLLPSQTD